MICMYLDRASYSPGIDFPYSGKLFFDLSTWRDQNTGLVGRVTTELALIGVTLIALIEFFIRIPLTLVARIFSKEFDLWKTGLLYSFLTVGASPYSLWTNLFVQNLTSSLIDSEGCHNVLSNETTESLYSRIEGYPKLNPLFDLNDYEKGYLELKLHSHWLGLKGTVELCGNNLRLEGNAGGRWMFDSLATAIGKFIKSEDFKYLKLGTEKAQLLEDALNLAYMEHSPEKISQRVRDRKLSFLEAGWNKHGIGLAFYGDYMALGNRGVGCCPDYSTLEVCKIDPSLLTPEIVREIDSFKSKDLEAGKEYFYKTLPAKLSPSGTIKKDSLCTAFKLIAPFLSKGGHCALAGKKSVLRFAWVMLLSDMPDDATLRQGYFESKIFTDWTAVEKHKEFTPEKLAGLKEPEKVYSYSNLKADHKWERLQYHRWQAGCISFAQWNWSPMKNAFDRFVADIAFSLRLKGSR